MKQGRARAWRDWALSIQRLEVGLSPAIQRSWPQLHDLMRHRSLLSSSSPKTALTVREILSQEEFHAPDGSSLARGITIGKTTVDLLKPCCRLLDLLDAPEDIPFLSNLDQREIVYRLLRGPHGERLRAIATLGGQSHRTARAIAWLRANYTKPLRLEELAEVARMGISTTSAR